jgi:hypothetical protein
MAGAFLRLDRPDTTRLVTRGAVRLLRARGWSALTEFPLPDGRRADLIALSGDGLIRIVEVKSSIEDFRSDRKWLHYRRHCDMFYFAIAVDAPQEPFPSDAGLIVADAHGGAVEREAPERRLAPATRRAILLRFAMTAAERLHVLAEGREPPLPL